MSRRRIIFFLGIYFYSLLSYAIPFSIVVKAGTSLPTQITSGWFATALYTVSNSTLEQQASNFVKRMPPGVTQVTTDANFSDLCGSTFTLSSVGLPGSSCTLELQVSESVSATDPNPDHHLMVCLSDGISCAGPNPANSLNVAALTSIGSQLLGGVSGGDPLLLAARLVNGVTPTYTYIVRSNQLDTASTGSVVTADCNTGTFCVAGGHFTPGVGIFPLISVSTDSGQAFSDIDIADLIPGFQPQTTSEIFSVTCNSSICLGGGFFRNPSSQEPPLLVRSSSGNLLSWNYVDLSTVLPSVTNGNINGVSCTDSFCVAAGTNTSAPDSPILLVSTNQGQTWSVINATTLIPSFNSGQLASTNCSGSLCVAAGLYATTTSGSNFFPLLLNTANNGQTWAFQNVTSLIPSLVQGQITTVNCSGQNCQAGGSYNDGGSTANTKPLLLVSGNGGASWSYINLAAILPNLQSGSAGNIAAISCGNGACVAGGNFQNGATASPAVLISSNNGQSWTFFDITTLNTRLQSTTVQVNGVNCTGAICTVGGFFDDPANASTQTPLAVVSLNSGASWSFAAVSPAIPSFVNGDINVVAG